MTIVKINVITVPADSGDELARRFAARAGAVDDQDGFEGFELLQPTDERTTWLVVTRWRDEAAFQAWVASPAFGHGHRSEGSGPSEGSGRSDGSHRAEGSGGPADSGGPEGSGHEQGGSGSSEAPARPSVAVSSELWSFAIAGGSAGRAAG
ncbi:MAG: antibiotic biosynthesis monooxygenase [Actinomycetota bacterium]|nr:MAG: antibiotic biosynthesis monooxygenase [Actinomycetota bacterium]